MTRFSGRGPGGTPAGGFRTVLIVGGVAVVGVVGLLAWSGGDPPTGEAQAPDVTVTSETTTLTAPKPTTAPVPTTAPLMSVPGSTSPAQSLPAPSLPAPTVPPPAPTVPVPTVPATAQPAPAASRVQFVAAVPGPAGGTELELWSGRTWSVATADWAAVAAAWRAELELAGYVVSEGLRLAENGVSYGLAFDITDPATQAVARGEVLQGASNVTTDVYLS